MQKVIETTKRFLIHRKKYRCPHFEIEFIADAITARTVAVVAEMYIGPNFLTQPNIQQTHEF